MRMDPYRKIARRYDALIEPFIKGLRASSMKMVPSKEEMRVLDVGCGTGTYLNLYQKGSCKAFGMDRSPAMLDIARKKLGKRAEFHIGDAAHMPYPDGTFDLVVAFLACHEKIRSNFAGGLSSRSDSVSNGLDPKNDDRVC